MSKTFACVALQIWILARSFTFALWPLAWAFAFWLVRVPRLLWLWLPVLRLPLLWLLSDSFAGWPMRWRLPCFGIVPRLLAIAFAAFELCECCDEFAFLPVL